MDNNIIGFKLPNVPLILNQNFFRWVRCLNAITMKSWIDKTSHFTKLKSPVNYEPTIYRRFNYKIRNNQIFQTLTLG